MSKRDTLPHLSKPALSSRVDELRAALRQVPAHVLSERVGATYQAEDKEGGAFHLMLIDSPLRITYPALKIFDAQNKELPSFHHAMVMYYFDSASAIPVVGKWISFADLPDGRVYNSAFQGSTGDTLATTYGFGVDALKRACEKLNGEAQSGYGDVAYVVPALPRIPIMVNYWCGDEDFPSTCKLLFDESVSHYLPTEACAILGGMLARKLVKNAQ